MSQATRQAHEDSGLWSVHCEVDHKPMIRAWTYTKSEAEQRLDELRATDPQAEQTEYWILPLSNEQVAGFQAMGFIPQDALSNQTEQR